MYTPRSTGIQDLVVRSKQVVFINNFEFEKFPEFMSGADNIQGVKKIQDLALGPMLSNEGEVNGLFYFYNSEQGSLTLNTIKKMRAISRVLGGQAARVDITAEQLMIKVGLFLKMGYLETQLRNKEQDTSTLSHTYQQLLKQSDTMLKDVQAKIGRSIDCDREILQENPKYQLPESSFLHPNHPINQP